MIRLVHGDCRARLAELPEKSVHTVCTSPPYLGLRSYGIEPVDWPDGSSCVLGSEPTVELYVSHIVEVFRSVKRVLRDDGLCFINLGDSRAGANSQGGPEETASATQRSNRGTAVLMGRGASIPSGFKPLDLMGIPWRVALALQADGWTLRADIIWQKPAPMPESVHGTYWQRHRVKAEQNGRGRERGKALPIPERPQQDHNGKDFAADASWADCPGCPQCNPHAGYVLRRGSWRPTESHEYIFMFAKGQGYYADGEVLKEAAEYGYRDHSARWVSGQENGDGHRSGGGSVTGKHPESGRNSRSVWTIGPEPLSIAICPQGHYVEHATKRTCPYCNDKLTSHFAAYPTELAARCIKAGTSERGVCPKCGAPWARVLKTSAMVITRSSRADVSGIRTMASGTMLEPAMTQSLGWRPTCTCAAGEPRPAMVLDPFIGSGSTAIAADRLGRDCIGIDASETYLALAQARIKAACPMFAEVVPDAVV